MHEKVLNGPNNVLFIGTTINVAALQVRALLLRFKIVWFMTESKCCEMTNNDKQI